ncbi:TSUP family transporter [Beggiatoa alba]|nr:TSUP family transporter [Beggiatoa alba]
MESILDFSLFELCLIGLIFIWTGFVRSGLGFGGGALGLPLMLFVYNKPVFWLPIIGSQLLFFSALTLRKKLHNVDWDYLRQSTLYILPATLVGVFGLLTLPNNLLIIFIYSITLFYATMWLLNKSLHSDKIWLDKIFLGLGGYVAGTSLTGAPLMVAVFMRHVNKHQLRDTLFVLWFTLVTIKLLTFRAVNVDLHFYSALLLLPVSAIGHIIGLKAHGFIMQNDLLFKRLVGAALTIISVIGLSSVNF